MRGFRKNVTHSSIRWPTPSLVFTILAGILTTAGTGRALAQTEVAKLTASDAAGGDNFGWSVSVSGDVAVIGALFDDDAGTSSGSAYVYRYDPPSGDWIEDAKLTASGAAAGDRFGISVSVSGDLAVIGAYGNGDAGGSSGSAYVYRYDPPSGDWIEDAKLTASDAAAGDHFGISVSVSGDLAVIGAFRDDDAGSESGSVYVYRYDPPSGDWIEEAKLTASDAAAVDLFGRSVSVSGDMAVIGAPFHDDGGVDSGSAYVYRFDPPSGGWIEEAKLTASDAAAGDVFGISVSLSGDLTVIGSSWDNDAGSNSGSAYVFDLRIPGDLDGDGDVDLGDFAIYLDCVTGTGGSPLPLECLAADPDTDGDMDWADFALFQMAFTPP